MVKSNVYAFFDSVSEQIVARFIASNDKQALVMFKDFMKKNESINSKDFSLLCIGTFDNPYTGVDVSAGLTDSVFRVIDTAEEDSDNE